MTLRGKQIHAGEYIAGKITFCLTSARIYRDEAKKLEDRAQELRRLADESDAEAARWAAGTDFQTAGESAEKIE